jgi:hypothetical protein
MMMTMAALAVVILSGPAHAGLEDILYEKGQITKEEWLKAKADAEKAMGPIEKISEWQKKVSKLPILSDKFNIGLNVLQVQYLQNEAPVQAAGSADNRLFIRRAELIAWGKVNDYFPRYHMLADFGALSNVTANVASGSNNQILREAYVDIVPALSLQPYIDKIRIGQYRIPVGIEGSTSSGLIDFINRNYITAAPGSSGGGVVGTTTANVTGASVGSTIDFIPERDIYVDFKSKPLEQLELDLGIMNGNGINGLSTVDNNSQKDFFGRARVKPRKDMFFSFGTIAGKSTNLNSRNGGRGLGNYDRYIADFQIKPEAIPGLWLQGEFAWGHDAPSARTTSPLETFPAGSRGVVRTGWYVYGKYLIQSGFLKDWELLARYEEFDPSTHLSEDMLYRTTVGINYYFANMPPRVHAKLMLNYEFRHRGGNGPNTSVTPFDEFGNDALLLQLHVRWF